MCFRVGTNERDVIVITPSELESAPTLVQGTVVLSLNDSLTVKSITLRMYGVAQVAYYLVQDFRADFSWMDPLASRGTPPTRASQKQTKTVFEKEWSFLPQSQGTFTLKQGTAVEIAYRLTFLQETTSIHLKFSYQMTSPTLSKAFPVAL